VSGADTVNFILTRWKDLVQNRRYSDGGGGTPERLVDRLQAGLLECCIGPFAISMSMAKKIARRLAGVGTGRSGSGPRGAVRALRSIEAEKTNCVRCLILGRGTCDLYEARPITCRISDRGLRTGGGCDRRLRTLYAGRSDEEIAACVWWMLRLEEDEEEIVWQLALSI